MILSYHFAEAQLFANGDFENNPGGGCQCPNGFNCGNDAGSVEDGVHPVYAVGNQGCVTGATNYAPQLGANGGVGSVYFYAGADFIESPAVSFTGGEQVCLEVWYCGPQGSGPSGQNTANAHFSFGVDGVQVGPDVTVPTNTGWTLHTFTVTMTAGNHTFSILSGGAAQYSLWFDDFNALNCSASCDATITPAGPFCENDPAVNLTAVDGGGTWSGTGITDAANGTFDPATAGPGTHTITYTLGCGDTDTEDITVNALDDASFSYNQSTYCLSDPNPTPTITGLSGGTFTIDNGGTINATSGEIDIAASGAGSYTVTYTTNGPCPNTSTFSFTLTSGADATITPASFCENDAPTNLSAVDPGGTWSGTGITDATNGTFDPSVTGAGSFTITYTISGSCGATDTETITVDPQDDASFTYPGNTYCVNDPSPSPNITGLNGGTFSIDNAGVINATTGSINLSATGAGTYTVTYTTNGSCPNSETFSITIEPLDDASFTFSSMEYCINDPNPLPNITGMTGGTFTINNGGTIDPITGEIDISGSGTGSYTVTYTTNGPCPSLETFTVNISDIAGATISAGGPYCVDDPTEIFTAADGGGTWSGNGIDPTTGEFDPFAAGSGTWEIIYTIPGACGDADTVDVVVNPLPNVNAGLDSLIQEGQTITLLGQGSGNLIWSPGGSLSCTNCTNPDATPSTTTTYILSATDGLGCRNSDTVTVFVEQIIEDIWAPNIFSPNGDGNNDVFLIEGDNLNNFNLQIFNRWGEMIFESPSQAFGWDGTQNGKPLDNAVFVYMVTYTNSDGEEQVVSGNVTLMR